MLNTILIDAGPIIALFDKDDTYHKAVMTFMKGKGFKFITTMPVITEVSHMLDFSIEAQLAFLEWIMKEGVIIHDVKQGDISRIVELVKKYKDLPMDFADATLVVAAEQTGIKNIVSIDPDFDIYRLPGKVKIDNIFSKA
jgi:predicted nucleic acid-binding protein